MLRSVLPGLKCEQVTVHDHGNGCLPLSWCNGSMLEGVLDTEPVFVTLRDVHSRFDSQWRHMIKKDPDTFDHCKTLEQFLNVLQNWTHGCPGGNAGVHCKVHAINSHYKRTHRVILWPQAFYMSPRTMPVCYHPNFLEERIQNQVKAITLCRGPYRANMSLYRNVGTDSTSATTPPSHSVWAAVRRLYDEDDRMWQQHCDDGVDDNAF